MKQEQSEGLTLKTAERVARETKTIRAQRLGITIFVVGFAVGVILVLLGLALG